MDAFFASVEQRDFPELKGKPLAVGGSSSRGVVAAASYEARKYGVFSAMPSVIAQRKCPHLIFVKPRFSVYKEVSTQIREVFLEYTDLVEPLSLDEAYLDVTNNKIGLPSATLIAKQIKQKILERTSLTCSAGISVNKFLAKTASDINKPDGITLIKPNEVISFIEKLKVKDFFGVGKVTAEKMRRMGILTGLDLKKKMLPFLTKNFGKSGQYYYDICRGIDNRAVNPNRVRKSVSVENTYELDLEEIGEVHDALTKLSQSLASRIEKSTIEGKTMVLKVKYSDFTQITRNKTNSLWLKSHSDFEPLWVEMIKENGLLHKPIRLLGLGLSQLNTLDPGDLGTQLTINF